MSPTLILTLVKDTLIFCGLAYILWFIHRADQNAVKIADMQAVMDQIDHNAQTEEKFREEVRNAEAQRLVDMQTVTAAVSSQRAPVIVRVPAGSGAVPGNPAAPASGPACAGGSAEGPGVDIRPKLNALELKYEGYLASCRALLAEWPQ